MSTLVHDASNIDKRVTGVAIGAILAVTLAFDILVELGVAAGVPYLVAVALAYFSRDRTWCWTVAAIALILISVGYVLSPSGGEPWKIVTNRLLAVIAVFATAALVDSTIRSRRLLNQHRLELEDRILERTARLQRANADLEHFAHLAAHDLREPVRRQQMLLSVIFEDYGDTLDPGVARELKRVQAQSGAMLGMIAGFRSLTGLGGDLETESIDLDALVRDVVSDLTDELPEVDVTIELPFRAKGYPDLVRALIRNLTRNAIRHGTRPLTLSFRQTRQHGMMWIVVSSRWDGDPATVTPDLFKAFVGSDQASSGLGLSICQRVVDRHQGQIKAEATDEYFTVEFTLGER